MRSFAKPLMSKAAAHVGAINTLDWNPLAEWVIATGGKDGQLKVWDFYDCNSIYNKSGMNSEPQLVADFNTASEVVL